RIESRLFQLEAVSRANDQRAIEMEAADLELRIKALLGLRPEADVMFVPLVALPAPDTARIDREARLAQRHPALAVARAEYDAAEQALRRQILAQYPDLGIGPAYENEDDQSRVGFGASLPIPLWNRNRQGIAEADARRTAAGVAFAAQ